MTLSTFARVGGASYLIDPPLNCVIQYARYQEAFDVLGRYVQLAGYEFYLNSRVRFDESNQDLSPDIEEQLFDVFFDESILHNRLLVRSAYDSLESGNVVGLQCNPVKFGT